MFLDSTHNTFLLIIIVASSQGPLFSSSSNKVEEKCYKLDHKSFELDFKEILNCHAKGSIVFSALGSEKVCTECISVGT